MIARIAFRWLFCFRLSQKSILGLIASIALVSPVLGDGKRYYNCQENPLECTYGKGKYAAGSSSSPSCTDRHPNCREYALRGNCIRNSQWMVAQCPLSCGICPTTTTADSNNEQTIHDCIDHHHNCPKWASEQECFINPPFINSFCPMSCIRCVNATVVASSQDNQGLESKAELQARIRYSQTDFGVWQSLLLDDINLVPATTKVLLDMGEYAQVLLKEEVERIRLQDGQRQQLVHPLLGPRAVCNNMRHDCAVLAAQHGCSSGPHLEMMLQECSFACRFCHETLIYHQCRSSLSSSRVDRISLEDSTLSSSKSRRTTDINRHIWKHLSTKHGAINLATSTTTFPNEWVASLNYSALWKDDGTSRTKQQPRNQLLHVAISAFQDDQTTCNSRSDAGSITTCNGPTIGKTDDIIPPATTTVSSMSSSCQGLEQDAARLLGIAPEYLEPLEFLHYSNTQKSYPRQVPMSEFDHHDQWKPSGHVLFTILVVLQRADKGGSIGFPDLDWLVVSNEAPILVWPTSTKKGSYPQEMTNMKSEILPVIQGDLYAIKIRVRQYPYVYNPDCITA